MDQNLSTEQTHFFLNQRSAVNDVNFLVVTRGVRLLTRLESSKIVFFSPGQSPGPAGELTTLPQNP